MTLDYIEIIQPIGTFYMCSIKATLLLKMVEVKRRSEDPTGVQRDLSNKRTKEIADYCSDPDAVFPTPIVVSVYQLNGIKIDSVQKKIVFPDNCIIGDVIDGQHRLWGISKSADANLFDLPVVFMFGLNTEEKAYIFATINSNQTKVNPSLIYDLFDIASTRSPQKTVHQIARAFHSEPDSPFFNRLKMLGRKEPTQESATLSQGTFCKSILRLITRTPDEDARDLKNQRKLQEDQDLPLRHLFIKGSDNLIAKILHNCFSALKKVFPQEWDSPHDNILWKTTGFNGIILSLSTIIRKGFKGNDLSQSFFEKCFYLFKTHLADRSIRLDKENFGGGGEQVQRKFANLLLSSIADINPDTQVSYRKEYDVVSFIESIPDVSIYEIFDITYMLIHGSVPYDTINASMEDDGSITILHPLVAETVSIPADKRRIAISQIEKKYMDGLDPDSWLGFKEALEKD